MMENKSEKIWKNLDFNFDGQIDKKRNIQKRDFVYYYFLFYFISIQPGVLTA